MCLHSFPLKKFGISRTKKEVLNLVARFNWCRIIIIYFLTISDGFFDWSRTNFFVRPARNCSESIATAISVVCDGTQKLRAVAFGKL